MNFNYLQSNDVTQNQAPAAGRGVLTPKFCPWAGHLTSRKAKMSNPPGYARRAPLPWGLTLTGA